MILDVAYSRGLLCALGVKCVRSALVLELLDAAFVQDEPSLSFQSRAIVNIYLLA